MSAKTLNEPLVDCACGGKPCIHKREVGDVFLYSVSCTRCGVATEQSEYDHEVYAWWSEGDVRAAGEFVTAAQRAARSRQNFGRR